MQTLVLSIFFTHTQTLSLPHKRSWIYNYPIALHCMHAFQLGSERGTKQKYAARSSGNHGINMEGRKENNDISNINNNSGQLALAAIKLNCEDPALS